MGLSALVQKYRLVLAHTIGQMVVTYTIGSFYFLKTLSVTIHLSSTAYGTLRNATQRNAAQRVGGPLR